MKPATSVHQIYFNNAYLGTRLRDIKLPEQCYLLGLIRGDQLYSIADNPEILEQDWLIAAALNAARLPELEFCLRHTKGDES